MDNGNRWQQTVCLSVTQCHCAWCSLLYFIKTKINSGSEWVLRTRGQSIWMWDKKWQGDMCCAPICRDKCSASVLPPPPQHTLLSWFLHTTHSDTRPSSRQRDNTLSTIHRPTHRVRDNTFQWLQQTVFFYLVCSTRYNIPYLTHLYVCKGGELLQSISFCCLNIFFSWLIKIKK